VVFVNKQSSAWRQVYRHLVSILSSIQSPLSLLKDLRTDKNNLCYQKLAPVLLVLVPLSIILLQGVLTIVMKTLLFCGPSRYGNCFSASEIEFDAIFKQTYNNDIQLIFVTGC